MRVLKDDVKARDRHTVLYLLPEPFGHPVVFGFRFGISNLGHDR